AVELRDASVDLLADRETFGALLGTVASKLRALDEGGEVGPDQLDLKAGLLHLEDLARHNGALLDVADLRKRIAFELLHAQRNALLLDVDVKHLGPYLVALLEIVDDLLAWALPVEIGEVDHAVNVAVEPEEQAELGLVLDLALDHAAGR